MGGVGVDLNGFNWVDVSAPQIRWVHYVMQQSTVSVFSVQMYNNGWSGWRVSLVVH